MKNTKYINIAFLIVYFLNFINDKFIVLSLFHSKKLNNKGLYFGKVYFGKVLNYKVLSSCCSIFSNASVISFSKAGFVSALVWVAYHIITMAI